MSHRVLVTGATGTVGSALVERLRASPVPVRVAARSPDAARERFGDGPESVAFDLTRPETWGAALDGVDRLFLLFPPRVGVRPVTAFVDAAVRTGVERVVTLSVVGADRVPVLPHRRIERHVERAGPAYTHLRAGWFVQNLSGVHRPDVVERDELFVPAGRAALHLVDARDVAAVAATALTEAGHENRAYDLTLPEPLDFDAVAAAFSDVLDREIRYSAPSHLAFVRRLSRRGVPRSLVAFMALEYAVVRLGLASRTTDDLRRLLGRDPTSVEQFVADNREAFAPAGRDG
ncbi:NmrA family NAD(P)-binding protein [Halomarina ordinaria]|uniref:NAD(P)H-binding protein n=1 Tax=Halomarina ordinaria TaxID=3033939 RepID=A0ABD5UBS2_9EURY|nr:NAD(P)H-binding protein [Halomarina sp. PSRA2]